MATARKCMAYTICPGHHPEKSPNPLALLVLLFPLAFADAAAAAAAEVAPMLGSPHSIAPGLDDAPAPLPRPPVAPPPPSGPALPVRTATVDETAARGKVVEAAAPRYFPTPGNKARLETGRSIKAFASHGSKTTGHTRTRYQIAKAGPRVPQPQKFSKRIEFILIIVEVSSRILILREPLPRKHCRRSRNPRQILH